MNTKKAAITIVTAMMVLAVFTTLIGPVSAELLPFAQTGNLYVLNEDGADSDSVFCINPAGQVSIVVTEDELRAFTGEANVDFDNCGIAFDDSGDMFFAEENSGSILRWSSGGAGLSWVVTEAQITVETGVATAEPAGIAFGTDDLLYVCDEDSNSVLQVDTTTNTVNVYVSDATLLALLPVGSDVQLRSAIVGGPGGMIYVASDGGGPGPNAIFAIAPGGIPTVGIPTVLTSDATFGFSDLDVFMTRAPDGDLIICDNSGSNMIYRVDTTTGAVSTFLTPVQIQAALGAVDLEGGIAFDNQGFFYLAEENSDSIGRFDSSGNGIVYASEADIEMIIGDNLDLDAGIAFAPVVDCETVPVGPDTSSGGAGALPDCCEKNCSTKVEQCDVEAVMVLSPIPAGAQVVAVGSDIYIDMTGNDNRIGAGDIRLTETCCGDPNTKVMPHDNEEINDVFTVLSQDIFTYMDSNVNGIFDVGDAIYLDADNNDEVSVDDIRLTASPPFDVLTEPGGSVAIPAGHYGDAWSRVVLTSGDRTEDLIEIGTGILPVGAEGTIQALGGTVDGDCSGTWTCPDKLYLNQPTGLWWYDEFVTIGDLRLYMPSDADVMPPEMGECMPDCGTRVRQCAKDAVYALRVDTGATWGYVDESNDNIFKPGNCPEVHGEAGYIDMDNNGVVSEGDVRFTAAVSCKYPPNSKVTDCDWDLDHVLETPQVFADDGDDPQTVFRFADIDDEPGYSSGDPVYADVDNSYDVSRYDVRVTQSPLCEYGIYAPGDWGASWSVVGLTDYDAQHDLPLAPLPDRAGGDAVVNDLLGFIDSDCNLCWSCPDKLYMQQLVGAANYDFFVTIGDIRFYIPPNATGDGPGEPCWEPCGTKVEQCDVDLVYALTSMPWNAQVRYVDEDGGGFGYENAIDGDGVYIDMDGNGIVSEGDIRLSHVCKQYPPNTKVGIDETENMDLWDVFMPPTDDAVIYADIDGIPGYSLGDPLYLSVVGPHNVIKLGDIRLTASPVYDTDGYGDGTAGSVGEAWTRVVPGDADLLWAVSGVPIAVVGNGVLEDITNAFDSDCSGSWTCPDKLYLQQIVTNWGFETGTLSGWNLVAGSVEVLANGEIVPHIAAPQGTHYALLSTGPGDMAVNSPFNRDVALGNENDVAILQRTFFTVVPTTLTFDLMFLTSEADQAPPFDDIFEVTMDGVPVVQGSVDQGFVSSPFPFVNYGPYNGIAYTVMGTGPTGGSYFDDGRTGFTQYVVNVVPGLHTIEFYVGDQGNHIVDSGILIDVTQAPAEFVIDNFFVTIGDERLYMPPCNGTSGPECNQYDTNCDCTIDFDEVMGAVQAYFHSGGTDPDFDEVMGVIQLYYNSPYCQR